jgi:hypothetical protein
MGSKDAIKKAASLDVPRQNAKVAENPTNSAATEAR